MNTLYLTLYTRYHRLMLRSKDAIILPLNFSKEYKPSSVI
jgi:hypothetical protein